jgi:RHS repeat-associated protein
LINIITPNPAVASNQPNTNVWELGDNNHWVATTITYNDDYTRIDSLDNGLNTTMSVKYGTLQSNVASVVNRDGKTITSAKDYYIDFSGIESGFKTTGLNSSYLSGNKIFSPRGDLISIRDQGYTSSNTFYFSSNPSHNNVRNLSSVSTSDGNVVIKTISYPTGYTFGRLDSVKTNDQPDIRYQYYPNTRLVHYELTPKPGIIREAYSGNELLDNNFTVSYVDNNTPDDITDDHFVVTRNTNGSVITTYNVTKYVYNSYENIEKIYAVKPDSVMGCTIYEYTDVVYTNKVTKIIYPDKKMTCYKYDSKGRIIDIAQSKFIGNAQKIPTDAVNHTNYVYDNYDRIDYILMPPTNITGTLPENTTPADENGRFKVVYSYNGKSNQVMKETTYNEDDKENWVKQTNYVYRKDGSLCEYVNSKKNSNGNLEELFVKTSDVIPIGTTNTYSIITLTHSDGTAAGGFSKAQCVVYDKDGNTLTTYRSNNPTGLDITTCKFPNDSAINNYNFEICNEYSYTNQGQLLSIIDKKRRKTTFDYDSQNRVISVDKKADEHDWFPQISTTFHYNSPYTLTYQDQTRDDDVIVKEYNYDWLGNVLNRNTRFYVKDDILNSIFSVNISYGFDGVGNRNKITLPNGSELISSFDESGNLKNLTSPYGNIEYNYNQDSRLTGYLRGYANNDWRVNTCFDYDSVGKLTSITNIAQPTLNYLTDTTNKVKSIFNAFVYDSQGRLNSYKAQVDHGSLNVQNWQDSRYIAFNYNSRGQLTNETHKYGGDMPGTTTWSEMVYNYDTAGSGVNLTGIDRQLPGQTMVTAATMTFDANNRIIDDVDGNYYFNSDTGNPTTYNGKTMNYDMEDRLTRVVDTDNYSTILECGYYADGKRAWKCGASTGWEKTYYIYEGDLLLCEVKQPVFYYQFYDYLPAYVSAVNLWGADGLAGRVEKVSSGTAETDLTVANYTTTWYAYDQQGTVAQRFNADGTLKNVYVCDAFGNTLAGVEEVYSYNAKSGYYYDSETGFYYCLQRYYDPANGRWLTEDPIGYEGGLNLYGYCGNSPVGSVDPSGLSWNWGEFGIESGKSIIIGYGISLGISCIAAAGAPVIIPVAICASVVLLVAEGIELGINIYYRNETRGSSWENVDEVIHERYGSDEKICGNILGSLIGGWGGARTGGYAGNKILKYRATKKLELEVDKMNDTMSRNALKRIIMMVAKYNWKGKIEIGKKEISDEIGRYCAEDVAEIKLPGDGRFTKGIRPVNDNRFEPCTFCQQKFGPLGRFDPYLHFPGAFEISSMLGYFVSQEF